MKWQPTGFSHQIFKDRYSLTDSETWEQACLRIAKQMALAEPAEKQKHYESTFNNILVNNLFVPGGRIWYNSGRNTPSFSTALYSLINWIQKKVGEKSRSK